MQGPAARAGQIKIVDRFSRGTWKYGDYGEVHSAVAEATGKTSNDVEMSLWAGMMVFNGVLSDDGKKITYWDTMMNELGAFEWMTDEEFEEMKNYGDPANAPSSHYKIQPENLGKFLFITGAPGLGKSTLGHLLSKMAGYVHYEGDCFDQFVNPYISPEATEPSLEQLKQKPLIGIPQDRVDAIVAGQEDFMALAEGKEYNMENVEKYYIAMCKDIASERKRIGGDWAVAHACPSRHLRDVIKAELGPDLIFVVLNLSKEEQMDRLRKRHGEENEGVNELLGNMYDLYEPATEDEENAINLVLTNEMTREEVAEKLLKMLK